MAGHGHIEHVEDKRIALLIAILALGLALIETGAKSAQTTAISRNVEVSDTWNFYQARTIRQTVVRTAAEEAEITKPALDPASRALAEKQLGTWRDTANRWEDDAKGGEGRKQLAEKARHLEHERETALAKYHLYEFGAALLQVAIVVTSASIVTGVPLLAGGGILLGLAGLLLGGVGFVAPEMLHF